ncbi:hypothetical protein K492DRAFT_193416 [Lichtheimia hyalospora FSU 10163]|nr:hypothetical protein K492DRAFT_193416 [Lichtheimia hyalospora FSU 10163]
MTLESSLRSIDKAANSALESALIDTGVEALPQLNKVLALCKDLRRQSYYLDYFRLRRKIGDVDVNWLQRAIQRINLVIFTAAVWTNHPDDLKEAIKEYFTKVIPRGTECTTKLVDAYMNIKIQLAYREILPCMEKDGETDAEQIINKYFPGKLIHYNLPANKSGKERILPRAKHIIDEFYKKVNTNDDMNRFFPIIRMRQTWKAGVLSDIEEELAIEFPYESPPSESVIPQQQQSDIPKDTTSATKPATSVSQSSTNKDTPATTKPATAIPQSSSQKSTASSTKSAIRSKDTLSTAKSAASSSRKVTFAHNKEDQPKDGPSSSSIGSKRQASAI